MDVNPKKGHESTNQGNISKSVIDVRRNQIAIEKKTSDEKSEEAVAASKFDKELDEMTKNASTVLKKKKIDHSIKELVSICKSSFINELEEKPRSLSGKIREKGVEVAEIDKEIKNSKDCKESIYKEINQEGLEPSKLVELEFQFYQLEFKLVELNDKKKNLQCEKWMLEKEKDIASEKESILREVLMHCNNLVKNPENPEQPLQELDCLSREFRSLEELHQNIKQKQQEIYGKHEKILKDQKDILQERQEILKERQEIIKKMYDIRNNLIYSNLSDEERTRLKRTYGEQQERQKVLDEQSNSLRSCQLGLQKQSDTLQKLYDTGHELRRPNLSEAERAHLERSHEVLQKQSSTLHKHCEVLQKLGDTQNNLRRPDLSEAERAYLERSHEVLQEESSTLHKHCEVLGRELERTNLSQEQHAQLEKTGMDLLKHRLARKKHQELLQKHLEDLHKFYDTQNELKRSTLSPEERTYLEKTCQHLQERQKVLDEQSDTLQKHWEVLQDVDKTQYELVHPDLLEAERANLQQTYNSLLKRCNGMKEYSYNLQNYLKALQYHHNVLQKLYDTHNNLKRPNLSPEERTYLERTCQHLQEHQEVPQKRLEVQQKLYQNSNILGEGCLRPERSSQPQYHYLRWLKLWYKTLVEQTGPDLSSEQRKRLEIKGSICKEAVEVAEKLQHTQEKLTGNHLPEAEHAILKKSYDLRREYFRRLCKQKEYVNIWRDGHWQAPHELLANLQDPLSVLPLSDRQLEKEAEALEELHDTGHELRRLDLSGTQRAHLERSHEVLNTLQKRYEVQRKLDDIQSKLGRLPYLSRTERAHLERSREVLQEHSEVLQRLYGAQNKLRRPDLSGTQRAHLERSHEVLQEQSNTLQKRYEVLQKLYDTEHELRRPDLSQKQRKNLQYSRRVLEMWKENSDKLADSYTRHGMSLEVKSSRVELIEALEKSLLLKKQTKLKTSLWMLKKWHKKLDNLSGIPSWSTYYSANLQSMKKLKELYHAWGADKMTMKKKLAIIFERKSEQYRKSFVKNACWKMLCEHH